MRPISFGNTSARLWVRLLVAALGLAAAVSGGTADISAYAPSYQGIVYTERGSDGSRLVLVDKSGARRVLTGAFHSAADPAVSFDAKWILFAGRKAAADPWNIWEMALDGSSTRQVTKNFGNCRNPIYQSALFYLEDDRPSYQLTFVSDEAGADNLYSIRLDGQAARRLTYNMMPAYAPFQLQDGRILFTTSSVPGRFDLFAVQLDGTDYVAFSGAQGQKVKHMACSTPKKLVAFVETDRPGPDAPGTLATLSLRRNLHSYRPLTKPADGQFHSPSPLPDGSILAAWRPAAGQRYQITRVDLESGKRIPVTADASHDCVQPVAVVQRAEPDGHSSVVEDGQNWSKLYGLNVYETDLKREWMPEGSARRIRVLEGVPGSPARRLLGSVALASDGSFHLQVPPNIPIQLQLLDAQGMALRTSAWIWTKNKEQRGCIGCHEDGERTPENRFAEALGGAAANLMLPAERRRTVEYTRDILPIFKARCSSAACHGGPAKPSFDTVRDAAALRVVPGSARTSPLVWSLAGRNTSKPWDPPVHSAPPKRMPPAGSTPLTPDELQAIYEWIDFGAHFAPAKGAH